MTGFDQSPHSVCAFRLSRRLAAPLAIKVSTATCPMVIGLCAIKSREAFSIVTLPAAADARCIKTDVVFAMDATVHQTR